MKNREIYRKKTVVEIAVFRKILLFGCFVESFKRSSGDSHFLEDAILVGQFDGNQIRRPSSFGLAVRVADIIAGAFLFAGQFTTSHNKRPCYDFIGILIQPRTSSDLSKRGGMSRMLSL